MKRKGHYGDHRCSHGTWLAVLVGDSTPGETGQDVGGGRAARGEGEQALLREANRRSRAQTVIALADLLEMVPPVLPR